MHACMYVCMYILVYTYTYIYIYVRIYIYTYEHHFFLGTGDMTKTRLGIVRVVAHPAARMFA